MANDQKKMHWSTYNEQINDVIFSEMEVKNKSDGLLFDFELYEYLPNQLKSHYTDMQA